MLECCYPQYSSIPLDKESLQQNNLDQVWKIQERKRIQGNIILQVALIQLHHKSSQGHMEYIPHHSEDHFDCYMNQWDMGLELMNLVDSNFLQYTKMEPQCHHQSS